MAISAHLWAVVGLGNPGELYGRTRHNLGFMLLQRIRRDAVVHRKRTIAGVVQVQSVSWRGWDFYLVKPLTYMNMSGIAVHTAVQRYGWSPQALLVAYDDVDLPLGRIRLRVAGSAGGHRGMTSVIEAVGTDRIPRLRLGIGVEPRPNDLAAYVLSPFRPEEEPVVDVMLERAIQTVEMVLRDGFEMAMNWANRPEWDQPTPVSPSNL